MSEELKPATQNPPICPHCLGPMSYGDHEILYCSNARCEQYVI